MSAPISREDVWREIQDLRDKVLTLVEWSRAHDKIHLSADKDGLHAIRRIDALLESHIADIASIKATLRIGLWVLSSLTAAVIVSSVQMFFGVLRP